MYRLTTDNASCDAFPDLAKLLRARAEFFYGSGEVKAGHGSSILSSDESR
jgi:hypothetical protein